MKCSVGLMRHPGIFLVICVQNEWQTAIMLSGGCNACCQEDVRSLDLAIESSLWKEGWRYLLD